MLYTRGSLMATASASLLQWPLTNFGASEERERGCPHTMNPYVGVSENGGPQYSTLNSRILTMRTPNKVPLILGNFHMEGLLKGFSATLHPVLRRRAPISAGLGLLGGSWVFVSRVISGVTIHITNPY